MTDDPKQDIIRADLYDGLRELLAVVRMARQYWIERFQSTPAALVGPLIQIDRTGPGVMDGSGCHLKDLAARLALDPSTVSRGVASLVSLGLVERRSDPADRRAAFLAVTPAGQQRLAEIRASFSDVFADALGAWDPDDIAAFSTALRRFAGDVRDHLGGAPDTDRAGGTPATQHVLEATQ